MSFWKFVTQKSGFGKISWSQFSLIQLVVIGFFTISFFVYPRGGWEFGACFGFIIEIMVWISAWSYYSDENEKRNKARKR